MFLYSLLESGTGPGSRLVIGDTVVSDLRYVVKQSGVIVTGLCWYRPGERVQIAREILWEERQSNLTLETL